MKDTEGRYLAGNGAFARRMGRRSTKELLGRTVDDFFPPDLALAYRAEDRALARSGVTTRNQLETITDRDGQREWFLSTRVLHREAGFEDAIVAVSMPTGLGSGADDLGLKLRSAIEFADRSDPRGLRVVDLAREAGVTLKQLERTMQRVLGVSPKQYLMSARLERAATLLATTNLRLSEVAAMCAYYDQSQFTAYFKDAYGVTPKQYRLTSADEDLDT